MDSDQRSVIDATVRAMRGLRVTAPVTGGSTFALRFAIWDAGDPKLDSTALLDNFGWLTRDDVVVGTKPLE